MTTDATAVSYGADVGRGAREALVPLGRLLFALIFLLSGLNLFSRQGIGYAAAQGVPWASLLVPLSGILALAGGLSILLGYRARLGAWLLVLFLVPVTVLMHRFWAVKDPMMAQMQQVMFMKNVSMLGGAFLITYFGAGPFSLDARRQARAGQPADAPAA
jgi:putative oxidoreductase